MTANAYLHVTVSVMVTSGATVRPGTKGEV
jgi:hypothetical protein